MRLKPSGFGGDPPDAKRIGRMNSVPAQPSRLLQSPKLKRPHRVVVLCKTQRVELSDRKTVQQFAPGLLIGHREILGYIDSGPNQLCERLDTVGG
jgi:hypothetical protein